MTLRDVFGGVLSPAGLSRTVQSARDGALDIAMKSAVTWLSAMAAMNLLWYAAVHVR